MSLSVKICLIVVIVFLYLDILVVCTLLFRRLKNESDREISRKEKRSMLNTLKEISMETKCKAKAQEYFRLKQSVILGEVQKGRIEQCIPVEKLEKKYSRRLQSCMKIRRAEAAIILGQLGTETARLKLERAIRREKDFPIRFYIANALSDIGKEESIPLLVASLYDSHRWYRDKVNLLIAGYGKNFTYYLPQIYNSDRIEMMELIIDFASVYYTVDTKRYLVELVDNMQDEIKLLESRYQSFDAKCCANCSFYMNSVDGSRRVCKWKGEINPEYKCRRYQLLPVSVYAVSNHKRLVYKAAEVLAAYYPKVLDDEKYLLSEDSTIRNIAVRALSGFREKENLLRLVPFLYKKETERGAAAGISRIIEERPEAVNVVLELFVKEKDNHQRQLLAQILAGKIEYFIMKLLSPNSKSTADLIRQIMLLGRTSEIIDFLNKNKNIDLENELLAIVKEVIAISPQFKQEASVYLNERLCDKCGLVHDKPVPQKRQEKRDRKQGVLLGVLLFVILMLSPLIYIVRHNDILWTTSWLEQLKIFIVDFNYYLAYYSITINTIYILLLILSFFQGRRQSKQWDMKKKTMLFKKRILPSVSIIAPAFNEEKTIIENVNSLLNLEYPDYELIIVNDGSVDDTLEKLIKYYNLVRVDYVFQYQLNTKPVRGVYLNRSIPKLIIVDKENGGKADSLNAGINIANKEYFCGIDADSVLEQEALLRLASLTLDQGIETPALGGNVFPINGCIIDKGYIKETHIPKNKLARIQNIEYLRAFMTGRLGWASLNGLLIISGAFGLFRKDRIVGIGGYLTSSGKYEKDTVGEDMELVVRIRRLMKELKKSYKICYAYNANCWTEVPEDLKSLRKQRYRWHRGLIEIMTFHKRMLFNPRYGKTGMLAMPYFFLFELIGPILEFEGYLMVVLAFILGLLNAQIALLLFLSTVLMGVFISVSSILIAEYDMKYYTLKEVLILIGYAILENFGPRQLISFWRVGGYLRIFGKPAGWGKPQRRGFTTTTT